jgi:hypothetical protein
LKISVVGLVKSNGSTSTLTSPSLVIGVAAGVGNLLLHPLVEEEDAEV